MMYSPKFREGHMNDKINTIAPKIKQNGIKLFLLKSEFLTINAILVTNSKIKIIRYSKIKSIIVYPISSLFNNIFYNAIISYRCEKYD